MRGLSILKIGVPAAALTASMWFAAPQAFAAGANINMMPTMRLDAQTLMATGTASCVGGGQAGVSVNGTISHRLVNPNMNPINLQMTNPVLVSCDGNPHAWSAVLGGGGRNLMMNGLGTADARLTQHGQVLANTGAMQVQVQ
jgi:hypothetical protein